MQVSIWARIAQLTAKRGLNDVEIALPLGAIERYAIRLKNTDVDLCPTTTSHDSARMTKLSNSWKMLPDNDNH
jgi:hypothetical protein